MSRTPELMLAGSAAEFLGISRKTLYRWNRSGDGPPRVLKRKRYWYSREALKAWLKSGAGLSLSQENGRSHSLWLSLLSLPVGLPHRLR